MRTAFISQLIEEARKDDRVFLVVGDLGYNVVESFAREFPMRFMNAGIAEQNMMGVAAGLAKEGFVVYVYSIGNFPTLRCMEQIRNDVAYHNLNVRVVSVGAGFAYGDLGTSHHATEEMGMMRILPDMVICSPCDPLETRKITTLSVSHRGPMYLRLGKAGEKVVHEELGMSDVVLGKMIPVLKRNARTAVLATGAIVYALKEQIVEEKLDFDLYSFPFVKPIDSDRLQDLCRLYDSFITVEEHQMNGGLGSAIVERINDLYSSGRISHYPKIVRKAIPDVFYHVVGNQTSLRKKSGLFL